VISPRTVTFLLTVIFPILGKFLRYGVFFRSARTLPDYKRSTVERRQFNFMKRKISGLIFGSLILGSLMVSTNPAMARHEWRWADNEQRWERRADLRREYRELEDARRQLEYDLRRGASRRRIAEDEARIRQIENAIRAERRELSRWYR
jgi:hypothetical protein